MVIIRSGKLVKASLADRGDPSTRRPSTGLITEAHSPCIACGDPRGRDVIGFEHEGQPWAVRRCERCRHHFLDGWDHTYDVEIYEYYAGRLGLPQEQLYDDLTTERLQDNLLALGALSRARLLDVGCGEGQMVYAALDLGFDARGIDVSRSAIAICRGFGLPCDELDLFAPALDDARFDIVTLVETIEHVPDPVSVLRRAGTLLAPGGVLWITTPNLCSLGRRILGSRWPAFAPAHISYFTPRSLRHAASAAGFCSSQIKSRTLSAAALRALLRRDHPAQVAAGAPGSLIGAEFAAEQQLRHRLESRPTLRAVKAATNVALSTTSLGETLVAELREFASS